MSSFVVETVARGGGDGSFGYKTGRIVGVKRLNVGQCPVGTMLMASVNRWNSRSNTFFVVSSHALARKCEDITARPWWWCGYKFISTRLKCQQFCSSYEDRKKKNRISCKNLWRYVSLLYRLYPCTTLPTAPVSRSFGLRSSYESISLTPTKANKDQLFLRTES